MKQSRRGFITATAGGAASIAVLGRARAESATLTGRVVSHDDQPIDAGQLFIEGTYYKLDNDGTFSAEVNSYSEVYMGFYKGEDSLLDPIQNGVPHIYDLGNYNTGSEEIWGRSLCQRRI